MNPNILKFQQIQRLIQRMIDRYTKFYEQRSASRERTGKQNTAKSGQAQQRKSAQQEKLASQDNLVKNIKD